MSKPQTFNRHALCPFYQSAYYKGIKCEGVIAGSYNRTVFRENSDCENFINRTCCTPKYKTCPVYLALIRKYQ